MAYQFLPPSETAVWRARLGRDAPPPVPLPVRAGPLAALLDGIDLRYVAWGGEELVRRIHVAVRDVSWGTVPGRVRDRSVETTAAGFLVEFEVEHQRDELLFRWRGRLEGKADGTISYRLSGVAERGFDHNRIGICALLPPAPWSERELRAAGPDGCRSERLAAAISPQLLHEGTELPVVPAFERLTLPLADGELELRFAGDLWEIEDQRNWGDASFKAYSTPLWLGTPHRLEAGEGVAQSLAIRASGEGGGVATEIDPRAVRSAPVPAAPAVPAVGLLDGSGTWAPATIELLRRLGPRHLRLDLRASSTGLAELGPALVRAEAIGAELELADRKSVV